MLNQGFWRVTGRQGVQSLKKREGLDDLMMVLFSRVGWMPQSDWYPIIPMFIDQFPQV